MVEKNRKNNTQKDTATKNETSKDTKNKTSVSNAKAAGNSLELRNWPVFELRKFCTFFKFELRS